MLKKDQLIAGVKVFAIASVAAALVNAAQYYFVPAKQNQILVIDTAGVMVAKQAWFTKELTRPDITDADRMKVMDQTKQFVLDLDRELTKMQQDCNCVIFDKGAVIIGNYFDVTDQLKKKLNL